MLRRDVVRLVGTAALCTILGAATAGAATAGSPRPLRTAIVDPQVFTGAQAGSGFRRAAAAGATAISVPLFWDAVAPTTRRRGFRPADPSEPSYDWRGYDAQLRAITARGLTPIVYVSSAPSWASRTPGHYARPDPRQYAAFARAAVQRYSGRWHGLPRVRYWQAWNEPNVTGPSLKSIAPSWYRMLVNAFATSVHSVGGNSVIAGALSPFGISTALAPLTFMRHLLCVSAGPSPHSTCSARVHFDIWSTHPYTAGSPSHRPSHTGDVSIAELPQMRSLLNAARRLGHVATHQPMRFWVTEFSWDSAPPDPDGVPAKLEGRWVSEALHDMWHAGVSLVAWFTLRDQPFASSPYQSGLYFRGSSVDRDRAKPALTAFRFPFVAYAHGKRIAIWGHTPKGVRRSVVIEQYRRRSGWHRLALLRTNRVGIFAAELPKAGKGPLRVRLAHTRTASLPFSLDPPADHDYHPFGAPLAARPRVR